MALKLTYLLFAKLLGWMAVIEPLLPAVRAGGRLENTHVGRSWTRSCMWFGRVLVAAATGGFPAVADRVLVLQPVGTGWCDGQDPARGAGAAARAGWPQPRAGLIDSQSVKGADTVGRDTRGYDAGKKVNGRKRFIVTDTLGLLLVVVVLSASVQDRDGAKSVLLDTYLRTPVRFVFADGGFAGRLLDWTQQILRTTVHIVRKPLISVVSR